MGSSWDGTESNRENKQGKQRNKPLSSPFDAAQPSDSGWSVPETDKFPINTVPAKKKKNKPNPNDLTCTPSPCQNSLEY